MAATLTHEGGAIYRLDISGVLRKADFARVEADLAAAIDRGTAVRLFVQLNQFEGWADGDSWSDLSFYMSHGDRIARIAIVGDDRWRDEALMFASADLRKAPVQFFPAGDSAQARTWLNQ